jgi:hypothetical protein
MTVGMTSGRSNGRNQSGREGKGFCYLGQPQAIQS